MRVVQIAISCDPCLAWKEEEVTDGVETVHVVGSATIDLCPDHRVGLREVLALLDQYADCEAAKAGKRKRAAALPGPPGRDVDELTAEVTGKRTRRAGKRHRARREAHAERAPVEGGLACPLCAERPASSDGMSKHLARAHGLTPEAVYGLSCPVCGHASATGRALGAHGRKAHGTSDGVPGLFARATADGDPLGIVAARASALADGAGG